MKNIWATTPNYTSHPKSTPSLSFVGKVAPASPPERHAIWSPLACPKKYATWITITSALYESDHRPHFLLKTSQNLCNFLLIMWLGKLPISMLPSQMQHLHYFQQVMMVHLHHRRHHGFLCTAVASSVDVPQQQDHHQNRCFPKSFLRKHAAYGKFSIAWTSCGQDAHCLQFPRTSALGSAGVDARRAQPAAAEVAQLPPGQRSCSPVYLLHAKQASKSAEVQSWSALTSYLQNLWCVKEEPFC